MPAILQGTIIWATVKDQHGSPPKQHPVMVVSPDEEVASNATIFAVVCSRSSALVHPRPDCWIPLPYHRQRKCATKLPHETVAVCTWVVEIGSSGYGDRDIGGRAPLRVVLDVIKAVADINAGQCTPVVACDDPRCNPPQRANDG